MKSVIDIGLGMGFMIRKGRSFMKKIIALLACIFLLNLTSCDGEEITHSHNIMDALSISVFALDERNEDTRNIDYSLQRLRMNEIVTVASGWGGRNYIEDNMSISIEFNGAIEVLSEDRDISISRNNNLTPWYIGEDHHQSGRIWGDRMEFGIQGFVTVAPIPRDEVSWLDPETPFAAFSLRNDIGRPYYLTVNAYRFGDEDHPFISARLRIMAEECEILANLGHEFPYWLTIEMVSYDFNDRYRLIYDIWDED